MTTAARWCRLLLLAALLPATAAANTAAARDAMRILRLSPADLPVLAGQRIEALRVATVRDGTLVPVPFQVDELSTAGLPWFAQLDIPLNGREGIFDGNDQVLLVNGDASTEPLPEGLALPAGFLGELTLRGRGEPRYLQFFAGDAMPLSTQVYVRHNRVTGITETPHYTLRVDPDNELNWQHLMVRSWRGPRDRSLIDTLKLRISGGVLTPVTRMSLDNDNLRPKVIGVRSGPIRSVMQVETAVVFAGVPVMRMQVQVHRYPHFFEAHTHARIPKLYKRALHDPSVRVTVDGNNLKGATVRTARWPKAGAIVDGRMDDTERAMVARGLSSTDDWILFDAPEGFSLLAFIDVPPELRDVPLQLVYEDDSTQQDRPERIPGLGPNIGYGIRGFPPGEDFRFGVTLAFDSDLRDTDTAQYVARWRERPALSFRAAR